jgi:hypothetical protein
MKELIYHLFGTNDLIKVFAGFIFASIGMLITMLIDVKQRDKKSNRTPENFSISFFIKDNILRFITTLLLVFIFLRFSIEIFGDTNSMYSAFIVGLCSDFLAIKLKTMRTNFLNAFGNNNNTNNNGSDNTPTN